MVLIQILVILLDKVTTYTRLNADGGDDNANAYDTVKA